MKTTLTYLGCRRRWTGCHNPGGNGIQAPRSILVGSLILLGTLLIALRAPAAVPEPDNVVYGRIALGTNQITAWNTNVVVEVRLSGDTNLLSRYRMGQNPAFGDLYVVQIRLRSGSGGLTAVTNGSILDIIVNDGSPEPPSTNFIVGGLTMAERGYVERIDFGMIATNALSAGYYAWASALGVGSMNLDEDGDGVDNYGEYVAGTNPTNAASAFLLQIARTNANTRVSFETRLAEGAGYAGFTRHYALERRMNLTGSAWEAVPGYSDIMGSNQPVACIVTNTGNPLYFRGRTWLAESPTVQGNYDDWAMALGVGGLNEDDDGDGVENYGEYVAGTNPTNAASVFLLQIARTNVGTHVTFEARLAEGNGYAGLTRHYALEQRTHMGSGSWGAVPGYSDVIGSNQPVVCIVTNVGNPLFLRGRTWLDGLQ